MKIMKKILKIISLLIGGVLVVCLLLASYLYISNSRVSVKSYNVYSEKIPAVFDGYKVAQISDFHNSDNYNKIADEIDKQAPNIIVITGDLITKSEGKYDKVTLLLNKLISKYPVYFSSGNHEVWWNKYDKFIKFLNDKGVTVLDNKVTEIEYKNQTINLVGYRDIVFAEAVMRPKELDSQLKKLYNSIPNKKSYNLLLFHRASLLDAAVKYPFDLILSGHTHGGQIGIPGINNWILQKRYLNSKYIKGYYRSGNVQMIVSGGLSKKLTEPRAFNDPELVIVTLKTIEK